MSVLGSIKPHADAAVRAKRTQPARKVTEPDPDVVAEDQITCGNRESRNFL
jgi:hypothetical protein